MPAAGRAVPGDWPAFIWTAPGLVISEFLPGQEVALCSPSVRISVPSNCLILREPHAQCLSPASLAGSPRRLAWFPPVFAARRFLLAILPTSHVPRGAASALPEWHCESAAPAC